MDKIGILTLYYKNDNYGGIAQAYALQKYIEMLGYNAEVISYKRTSGPMFSEEKKKISTSYIRNKIYKLPQKLFVKIKNKAASKKYYGDLRGNIEKRKRAFEQSRELVRHTEIIYTDSTIGEVSNQYDCFVSGSDQIWKPIVVRPAYVCAFLPEGKKKISYASSIAVTKYPEDYSAFMKKSLQDYSWVSVREEEAKDFITRILNRKVDVVVDPTLLLPFTIWDKMSSDILIKEKYVFSYMLGQSEAQRKKIKEYAKSRGLKLVTLPHVEGKIRACDINFGDEQLYDITLSDFFSLIKYAEVVITDSFHAVVFSIVFRRCFWVYERESFQLGGGTVSRLNTLLNNINLDNRLIETGGELPIIEQNIDYKNVYCKLVPTIEHSQNLLKSALISEDKI